MKTLYEQHLERFRERYVLSSDHFPRLRASRRFMADHLSTKLTLAQMAAPANMSRYHFLRVFQKHYGTTPRRYLRELRLSKAEALLKTGTSVTSVCFAVGYESPSTFSAEFKKGRGVSPRALLGQN